MRQFLKYFLIFLSFIAIFLILILVFLPPIVSSDWGTHQLVHAINARINGKIEINSLNLHWGKGQKIEGLVLRDALGQPILSIEKFYTEASLIELMKKSPSIGFTRLKNLNLTFVQNSDGTNNLFKALHLSKPQLSGQLQASTIQLSHLNADVYLTSNSTIPFSGSLSTETLQNQVQGNTQITFQLQGLEGKTWKEWWENSQKYLTTKGGQESRINVNIENFPVELLDCIWGLCGSKIPYFTTLLGDRLSLQLQRPLELKDLALKLTLQSPQLHSNILGIVANEQLVISMPEPTELKLPVEAINTLSHLSIHSVTPLSTTIKLKRLALPLNKGTGDRLLDFSRLSVEGEIFTSPLQLYYGERELAIDASTLKFASNQEEENVYAQLHAKASHEQHVFTLDLDGHLNSLKEWIPTSNWYNNIHLSLKTSPFPLSLTPLPEFLGEVLNLSIDLHPVSSNEIKGILSFETEQVSVTDCFVTLSQKENKWDLTAEASSIKVPFPDSDFGSLLSDSFLHLQEADGEIIRTHFTGNSTLFFRNQPSKLMPEGLKWTLDAHLGKSQFNVPEFEVTAKGFDFNLSAKGEVSRHFVFTLQEPLKLSSVLTPEGLEEISTPYNKLKNYRLMSPSPYSLSLMTDPIDMKNGGIGTLSVRGEATVTTAEIRDSSRFRLHFKEMAVPFEMNSLENRLNIDLRAYTKANEETQFYPLSLHVGVFRWLINQKPDFTHAKINVNAQVKGLSASIFSKLITNEDLTPLTGPSVDIEFKTLIDREQIASGYWDMNIDSALVHAKARLVIDDRITLYDSKNPSALLRMTLSQEGLNFLKNHYVSGLPAIDMGHPPTLNLSLSALSMSSDLATVWSKPIELKAALQSTPFEWKEHATPSPLTIEGSIDSDHLQKSVRLNFALKGSDTDYLSLNGLVSDLFDKENFNTIENINILAGLRTHQFPAKLLNEMGVVSDSNFRLVQMALGDRVDSQLSLQLSQEEGFIKGQIKGNNGQTTLSGKINEGILTLDSPWVWELQNPSVLNAFEELKKWELKGRYPLRLTIDPQAFSISIHSPTLENLSLGQGKLEMETITVGNTKELKDILAIFSINESELSVRFTPVYFNLKDQILNFKRFDFLLGQRYPLACWGKYNWKKNELNSTLGLTKTTLEKLFGVKNLSPDDLLQIPLYTEKGKLRLNKTKLMAKIAALVAQKSTKKPALLDALITIASETLESKAPPPTTTPLPW